MADSFVQVPADGSGKKLDTRTQADGDHREVVVIGDATATDVVTVDANGLDVDVTRLPALPAGNNNIGDVDIASLPNEGQQTMVNSISVAVASDQSSIPVSVTGGATAANQTTEITSLQLIDDPIQVLGTDVYTEATSKGMTLGAVRRDADTTLVSLTNEFGPLQMDANGRLKVEAFSGEAFPVTLASTTITGSVDTELPAAAALADATANPTTPLVAVAVEVFNGTTWDRARGDITNGLDVDVTRLPALVAGTANIGDVDVLTVPAPLNVVGGGTEAAALRVTVANDSTGLLAAKGAVAADLAVNANPVTIGGRASTAQPTAVSADGDSVNLWTNRKGSPVVTAAPHVGLLNDPWALTGETAQYTTIQTSGVLVAGGVSEKIVVTKVQIQVGGTTAGTLQLYFGTGAYARGTNLAIFDGEFAPSATLKPGVVMDGPFISATNGDDILVTTSAAINPLTITVWYYVIT